MDHGMTAEIGSGAEPYFILMANRFRDDDPLIDVRPVPSDIATFIAGLDNDATVAKPVDDLYIASHASGDGFLFVRLFPGQVDIFDNATHATDFEVLDQATRPGAPAKIPDQMIGYPPAVPPGQGHHVHIKGCNIGRDRFRSGQQQPNPFLAHLRQALGDHVEVTAPRHFHGLLSESNHDGTFEFMAHQLVVQTKTPFANRDALVTAYQNANLHYYNGDPVPDADWKTLVPANIPLTGESRRLIMTSYPLGQTIEKLTSVGINKQFRVHVEEVGWSHDPGAGNPIPNDKAGRLAMLKSSIAADARFDDAHAWPIWERRGFASFDDYFDGHEWSFSINQGTLVAIGRRTVYTVVEPIVDRTKAPPRPLIFNFYPGPGSAEQSILTGLDESDNTFFGRA
jgi:hypothetical protein